MVAPAGATPTAWPMVRQGMLLEQGLTSLLCSLETYSRDGVAAATGAATNMAARARSAPITPTRASVWVNRAAMLPPPGRRVRGSGGHEPISGRVGLAIGHAQPGRPSQWRRVLASSTDRRSMSVESAAVHAPRTLFDG